MTQLLITGGVGFIDSHTSPAALRRVLELAKLPAGDPRLHTITGDFAPRPT